MVSAFHFFSSEDESLFLFFDPLFNIIYLFISAFLSLFLTVRGISIADFQNKLYVYVSCVFAKIKANELKSSKRI